MLRIGGAAAITEKKYFAAVPNTVRDDCGGLGDAVASAVSAAGLAVHRLAVREIPRSGKPEELLERFGIGAKQIVEVVRA